MTAIEVLRGRRDGIPSALAIGRSDSSRPAVAAATRSAFEAAAAPHYLSLTRRMALVAGDPHDGEDLAQETYLRAYRSWASFDGTDVRAWLYTIGLRLAFNHRRRRRRWLDLIGPGEPEAQLAPSDPDLWAALESLEQRPRAALLLNIVDGYTQAEIASMLDVPEGTVASWVSRGRAVLREQLGSGA